MLLSLFSTAVQCFDTSFLQTLKSDCVSKPHTTSCDPIFTLKPLLFTPKPRVGTYYTIFDDYLVQPEFVCFDNETGEPCPGSQVNGYLYDIRQGLTHGVVDQRAFLYFMRRFLYYYDNTVNGDELITPTGSVLNIPATYARIAFDPHKVYCCLVNSIYTADFLTVFEAFITQAKEEIEALLAVELAKIKVTDKKCDVVCLPLTFVYLKTLNEVAAFFQALIACVKTATADFKNNQSLYYRIVSLKTKDLALGSPFINVLVAPVSGPVPTPLLAFQSLPPVVAPVVPDENNGGDANNGGDEAPSGFNQNLEMVGDEEEETSDELVQKLEELEDEEELTEEELAELEANPVQQEGEKQPEESESGTSQTFLQTFATTTSQDYSKVFSKTSPVSPSAESNIPLKKVATFCSSGSIKKKCLPGAYQNCYPNPSSSPINPCYSSEKPTPFCGTDQAAPFVLQQLLSGQNGSPLNQSNPIFA